MCLAWPNCVQVACPKGVYDLCYPVMRKIGAQTASDVKMLGRFSGHGQFVCDHF
jgi:hypothetical protein